MVEIETKKTTNPKVLEDINELIKKCDYEYDVDVHDLDEESLAMLVESLNTIPFLTSHKIVVCKFPKFLYKPDRLANYPLHSIMTTFYHKYSNLKIADIKNKYFYNILQLKGLYLNIFII